MFKIFEVKADYYSCPHLYNKMLFLLATSDSCPINVLQDFNWCHKFPSLRNLNFAKYVCAY